MTERTGSDQQSDGPRPVWICPRCGHRFVSANIWHSCSHHDVDEHFAGRPTALRATFDHCVDVLAQVGPITVIAQKTRIVIMVRVRFNGAVVRCKWMDYSIALRREVSHPLLRGVAWYSPRWAAHTFRFTGPADVDDSIENWLREPYAVGAQQD